MDEPPLPPSYDSPVGEPEAPRKLSRRVALISVTVAVLGAGGFFAYSVFDFWRPLPVLTQTIEEKHQETSDAYCGHLPVGADQDELQALRASLDQFQAVSGTRDEQAIAACCDFDAMFTEIGRKNPAVRLPKSEGEMADFVQSIAEEIISRQQTWQLNGYQIAFVHFLGNHHRAAVVYLRQPRTSSDRKTRYWMVRHRSDWKIYDREDLKEGFRHTEISAQILATGSTKGYFSAFNAVDQAAADLEQNQWSTADGKMVWLDSQPPAMPPTIDAQHFAQWAAIHIYEKKYDAAMIDLTKADHLRPAMPYVDLLRAQTLNGIGIYDEADFCATHF